MFKKKAIVYLIMTMGVFLFTPAYTKAATYSIDNFQSQINIQANGVVNVQENIQANFGNIPKHGIFRDIPNYYTDSNQKKIYLGIKMDSVSMDGHSETYSISQNGNYLEYQVGDPHQTIIGSHLYTLNYQVTGALRHFSSFDELDWNVTGNAWDTTIQTASATVTLNNGQILQSACYQGPVGSSQTCQKGTISGVFQATGPLSPGDGLTVSVGFPVGTFPILVAQPPTAASWSWVVALLIFILIVVIAVWLLFKNWVREGRDANGAKLGVIAPVFSPPGELRPAELGALLDEKASNRDIASSLIDLAVRGFLVIQEVPKSNLFTSPDYIFKRTTLDASNLLDYEKILLNAIFTAGTETKMSDLRNSFLGNLIIIQKNVLKQLTDKGYFKVNPLNLKMKYYFIAGLQVVVGFTVLVFIPDPTNLTLIILGRGLGLGLMTSGVLTFIAAAFMSGRTVSGQSLRREGLGFKLFVSETEKYRQPFLENQNIFTQILPYAIAFGIAKKYTQAVTQMGVQIPNPYWFYGSSAFDPSVFGESMDNFGTSLAQTLSSSPASTGGGAVGGGFGGGGGGSW